MDGFSLAPATMRLSPAQPNPHAAADGLFLLQGDATAGPIQAIDFGPGVVQPPAPQFLDFQLRIFHFNDLHGHLMRFGAGVEESILPRLARKINKARQACQTDANRAVLAFSAGDDCSGSIFDEILTDIRQDYPVHPGYQLFSKMGLDAAGLGNHDLDRSPQFLAKSIQHNARFPVLAANLSKCSLLTGVCHPAALLVVRGLRIGLIGLVTRAETHLNPEICQIVHPVPVAQNLIPAFRPHCDVLILLTHLGYRMDCPVPMADAGDVELALSLPPGSIDLIIGGHSHTALNKNGLADENVVNGIPIVQSGAYGEFLGQVDLQVDQHGVTVSAAGLLSTATMPSDADCETALQPFIQRVRELWSQPIGQVEDIPDLNTHILLADFAKREMPLANFVTDALVERLTKRGMDVDFAMIDASALHCGLPYSASLTYGDCFNVMPYADTLRLYQVTSRQILDLLADNALRIDRPTDPNIERGFLQFSREVTYTVDLGPQRRAARATKIAIHETPLDELESKTFTVATTCFTRTLATSWETAWNQVDENPLFNIHQLPYTDTDILLRSEIVAYIREHSEVSRQTGARCDGRLKVKERR
jgi:2',3'-cyclic-nucleotide 2'-phosphodiesterase (5'-nucleotidase family)